MMWILIGLSMLIALLVFAFYVISRFAKFAFLNKIAGENNKKRNIIAAIIVIILVGISYAVFDFVNTSVILIHLGVFWICADLIALAIRKIRKTDVIKEKNSRQNIYYIGIFTILFTTVYLSIAWYLAHHVWEKDYTVETDKNVGNLRIVHFADSHLGTTFHGEGFAKHIEEIQKVNPDIVLITGDYVDDESTKEDMLACSRALSTLDTKYGVYFCFGNHDKGYYANEKRGYDGTDLMEELQKNGVKVLQDEAILIDDRFYVIGRQDRSEINRGVRRAEMTELVDGLDKDKFMVVMDHQPDDYENQTKSQVDLVLSGHTHGGQLFPITHVGEWIGENDRTYGYEKRDNTNFIVTSGISDWAVKFKTGCKSEFVVIDVKGY